jgi:hypothetical protein
LDSFEKAGDKERIPVRLHGRESYAPKQVYTLLPSREFPLNSTPAFAGSSLLAGVLGNGTLKNVGAEVLP